MATDPFDKTETADDFDSPARQGGWLKNDQMEDCLLLVYPLSEDVFKSAQYGDQPRIKTRTIILDGEMAGREIEGQSFINAPALLDPLRIQMRKGRPLLGRLVMLPNKATKNALKISTAEEFKAARVAWVQAGAKPTSEPKGFWMFADPSEADKAEARKWMSAQAVADPFSA